jgi:hypothetical protein
MMSLPVRVIHDLEADAFLSEFRDYPVKIRCGASQAVNLGDQQRVAVP